MGDYFVQPNTTTLSVLDGQTITVRTYLSHGDRNKMIARQWETTDEGKRVLRLDQVRNAIVTAYLVDWSLTDRAGDRIRIFREPVDVVDRILNDLFPDEFDAIYKAIDAHVEQMLTARAEEKKRHATADATTSPSLSAAAGVLTGSVS